ncbi:MAG: FAD-binding protein [Clostridia bacterium]|nr:FAD-binding protein [Clostridia bacterium]
MKRTLSLFIVLCLLALSLSFAGAEGNAMNPGTYYGVGNGRNGAIVVAVTVSENAIENVQVVASQETWNTGSVPVKEYPALIVENQSLNVDIVSGATISSVAMLNAVRDCISQAGGDPAQFNTRVEPEIPFGDCEADVVVIGAGGAGMTAACKAAQAGKSVILLEKLDILGGTSNYSIEGFGAVEDKTHLGLGSDTTGDMLAENLTAGNPNGTAAAFDVLAHNNGAAADWLRSIGAELTVAGGQTSAASSREVGELGVTIVTALIAECKKAGVDIRTASPATGLVMEDGAVAGVKVSVPQGEYTIKAGTVVLATGGFGANNEMVASYVPYLEGYKNSCTVGATGDGQKMAEAVGAQLGNMDYIRVNFTYTTREDGYYYYMGCLFNTGAIFVNDEGKRFVNDQGAYGVGHKVVEQGGSGWAIFDNSIATGVADVRHYGDLGLYVCAPTIEELAEQIGVDAQALSETVEAYKGYVAAGKDEEFGRGMLNMTFDEAPFYACRMTCRVQGTFGGITTNEKAEVLTETGESIPGLYAAGECANDGTWGANPAAVNIVFGTIAAQNAVEYLG